MTIKEAVKEALKTNESLRKFGKQELEIWFDSKCGWKQITTWKDFKKWIKENVQDELVDEFLNQEFNNKKYFYMSYTWSDGYVNNYEYRLTI